MNRKRVASVRSVEMQPPGERVGQLRRGGLPPFEMTGAQESPWRWSIRSCDEHAGSARGPRKQARIPAAAKG